MEPYCCGRASSRARDGEDGEQLQVARESLKSSPVRPLFKGAVACRTNSEIASELLSDRARCARCNCKQPKFCELPELATHELG